MSNATNSQNINSQPINGENGAVAALLEAHGGVMLAQILAITDDAKQAEQVLATFCRDLALSLPDQRGALPIDLIAALRERAITAADQAGFRRVARRRAKGDLPPDLGALPEAESTLLADAYLHALTEDELATRLRMTNDSAVQRLTRAIRALLAYAGLEGAPEDQEREILAAKYVVGLLRGPFRHQVARSRIDDSALAESIDWWHGALAGATRLLAPVPVPPDCRRSALGMDPVPAPSATRSASAGAVAAVAARAQAAAKLPKLEGGFMQNIVFWRAATAGFCALSFVLFGRIWWTELRPQPRPLPVASSHALILAQAAGAAPPAAVASAPAPAAPPPPVPTEATPNAAELAALQKAAAQIAAAAQSETPPVVPLALPTPPAPPPPPAPAEVGPPRQVAVLVDFERLPAWLAVLDPRARRLTVSPVRPQAAAPERVFTLWLLDGSGSNPRALGVLPALGTSFDKLPEGAEDGAMLAVSQESGTGPLALPTLPYLTLGALVEAGDGR